MPTRGLFWLAYHVSTSRDKEAEDVLRKILGLGLAPDARVPDCEYTLLVMSQNAACTRVLLAAGADVSSAGAEDGDTALHRAARAIQRDSDVALEQVELLLAGGADPRTKNKAGKTPAEVAAKAGEWLIAARLDTKFTAKIFAQVSKKLLRGAPMPKVLELLWNDTLAGKTALLDKLGELSLLTPGAETEPAESLGVPKKFAKKLLWFAAEADGALVGYYSPGATATIDESVIMVDNEGQILPYGRTLPEFMIMRAAEMDELEGDKTTSEAVSAWLSTHGFLPKQMAATIAESAASQPVPSW